MQNQYIQLIQNMHEMSSFKKEVIIQFLFNKLDLTEGKEDKYQLEKKRFLDAMAKVLRLPVGDSVEVISNQVDNTSVRNLLLDIVKNTAKVILNENDFSELDWVKSILK